MINLPYKEDRKIRLSRHLEEMGLAAPGDITWVRAISGEMCPPPAYFKAGGGAWGCLQSHLRIVQDATMDKLENYLVLEDDVVFHEQSGHILERFWKEVPEDWGQIYLGGQYLRDPEPVDGAPLVFRCRNVNRTHAFALRRDAFRSFQQHISHAPDYISNGAWHIDHQLGMAHERGDWNVYTPAWWIAGQEEGASDISGRVNPRNWWNYKGFGSKLPFIFLDVDSLAESSREDLKRYLHCGYNLKEQGWEDIGLDQCVGQPGLLRDWLGMIAGEALECWKLPAIMHAGISHGEVADLWGGGVLRIGDADLAQLAKYPDNRLFPHPLNSEEDDTRYFGQDTSAA